MRSGDLVFFYHSVDEKQVVGLARVTRAAQPDPTAPGEDWASVELAPVKPLVVPVTLERIRKDGRLRTFQLVTRGRLSVVSVTPVNSGASWSWRRHVCSTLGQPALEGLLADSAPEGNHPVDADDGNVVAPALGQRGVLPHVPLHEVKRDAALHRLEGGEGCVAERAVRFRVDLHHPAGDALLLHARPHR